MARDLHDDHQNTLRHKIRPSSYHGWSAWRCEKRNNGCTVAGNVEATGLWHTVAVIDAETGTVKRISRLVRLLNGQREDAEMVRAAFEVLRDIEEEGWNFATEMELEHVIERLGKGGARTA